MMLPIVSIIIPTYNQCAFICETLDSVIDQQYTYWECIIVDDGSTDNTKQAVQKYISEPRIRYIYQENQGVCAARNNGVSFATGKYVLFLDSDDKISPNFLQSSVDAMEVNEQIKVVAPSVQLFGLYKRPYVLPKFTIERLMGRNIFIMSSLCRREDIVRIGGFNNNMKNGLEDWDFWLSILENGGDVIYLEDVLFYYRIRKKSRNRSISKENFALLRRQIYLNHLPLFKTKLLEPLESFEYLSIAESAEYRIGVKILSFYRKLQQLL
ncbi:glycosyltransferase family 2 protein [Bacteroides thetaiotaomicron]|nr:glycosyltransferase family 2 protein [Bacteroides thetaiotaomicron]